MRFMIPAIATVLGAACQPAPADRVPDPPAWEIVGVIEGFYGQPWSHQDRLDMIAFMGSVGLEDYIYAPKDDPYHLSAWRDPYPPDELAQLGELADSAAARGVRLWYAISPGGSIQHASDEDYQVLMQKITAVAELGVDHFGLFVDDVNAELQHESDRAVFANLAEAHVALANRLAEDLADAGARLIFTPTTYTNAWGDRDYARIVGEGLRADVPIVWTGMDVASPVITAEHATEWGELISRPPLLWDNYPVNDFAPWRLFLGPVTGRSADLGGALTGLVSNPMNQAHASMIPLHTLASYVSDPAGYNPETAHQQAVADLFGDWADQAQPLFDAFGDNAWDDNIFEPLYFVRDTMDLGPIRQALAASRGAADTLATAPDRFIQAFAAEVHPILDRLEARLSELRAEPGYRHQGDTMIFTGREAYTAADLSPTVDGHLDDWEDIPSFPVHGEVNASVRFAADDTTLYLAVAVTSRRSVVRTGPSLPTGDHVQVVQKFSPGPLVAGTDRFVLVSAPDANGNAEAAIQTMRIDGFMTKWFQDNARLVFNSFHQTSMADPDPRPGVIWASRPAGGGYVVEVALPRTADAELLAIQVSDHSSGRRQVGAISPRPYPFNPATFVTVGPAPDP